MNHVIETCNLSFAYGRHEVLRDISLTVDTGNFYALLGRNGAGKTTLLKILAGLLVAQQGTSRTLGLDSNRLRPGDWTAIGYVSESQPLYDWYTGEELIAFVSALYPNWDDDFCLKLLKRLRLPLEREVRSYSKGERMKMTLLLAMAFHPRPLLLDEPFNGLDVLAKEQLISCLLETTAQEQWSVVFASHDLLEVERLADVIGLIDEGRLQISEPLESLQARFRKIQVFNLATSPVAEPSMLQPVAGRGHVQFRRDPLFPDAAARAGAALRRGAGDHAAGTARHRACALFHGAGPPMTSFALIRHLVLRTRGTSAAGWPCSGSSRCCCRRRRRSLYPRAQTNAAVIGLAGGFDFVLLLLLVRLTQLDPPGRVVHFLATRPVGWGELLAGKVLFVALFLVVPVWIVTLGNILAVGFQCDFLDVVLALAEATIAAGALLALASIPALYLRQLTAVLLAGLCFILVSFIAGAVYQDYFYYYRTASPDPTLDSEQLKNCRWLVFNGALVFTAALTALCCYRKAVPARSFAVLAASFFASLTLWLCWPVNLSRFFADQPAAPAELTPALRDKISFSLWKPLGFPQPTYSSVEGAAQNNRVVSEAVKLGIELKGMEPPYFALQTDYRAVATPRPGAPFRPPTPTPSVTAVVWCWKPGASVPAFYSTWPASRLRVRRAGRSTPSRHSTISPRIIAARTSHAPRSPARPPSTSAAPSSCARCPSAPARCSTCRDGAIAWKTSRSTTAP